MGATLPLTIGFAPGTPRRAPAKAPAHGDTPAVTAPANSAAGRNQVDAADDVAAWVRRAEGANGFGGDAMRRGPLSYRLLLQARAWTTLRASRFGANSRSGAALRAHRSAYLGALIATALSTVAAYVRKAHAAFRRRREARVMRTGLYELDDRTLRDIGFTRSEIESVVAEATGGAEWTRLRTRWLHGQP